MALTTATPRTVIQSAVYNEIVGLLNGTAGYGNQANLYRYDNSASYSVTVGNVDTTNGYALKVQYGSVASPTTLATFAKSVTQIAGGAATDATYGGNRGGIRVFDDGSVGMAGAVAKSPQNLFVASLTGAYKDTTIGMHTALFELDSASVVASWDAAAVKIVSRSGQSNAVQIAGIPGNNLTTLDLEGIWGTNNAVIGSDPTGTITGTSAVGRHTLSVGVATAHTQYDGAAGAYADKVNGIYLTSQGTSKFHASSTNGPNGIRANAAIYCHGTQGWEWFLYYVDTAGDKSNPLMAVNQYGELGVRQIPTAGVSIKQRANTSAGGFATVRSDTTTATVIYTGGDSKSYIENSGGGKVIMGGGTGVAAVEISAIAGLTANVITAGIQSGSTVFQVAAAGTVTFAGAEVQTGIISPTQLVANTDNWNPTGLSTARVIRATTDASRNLTGITAQGSGTRISICNVGSFDLVLVHDATSTAANRFTLPGAANLTLTPGSAAEIWYDTTTSRWRVVA